MIAFSFQEDSADSS